MGSRPVVRFSGWELDLSSRELRRRGAGTPVRLAEKPFLVLEELATRRGEVVTRRELVAKLWPDGTTVDFDNNLNTAVAALREVLEDTARAPRVIETIPRRGYRLIAASSAPRLRAALWPAAGTVALVVAAALLINRGSMEPTLDGAAQRAFLRGTYYAAGSKIDSLEKALAAFRQATTLDPDFAEAHAHTADVLSRIAFRRPREMQALLGEARGEAQAALRLDAGLPAAHRALALASLHLDWNFEAAGKALERALAVAPEDASTYMTLASYHSALSHHDEAIAAARRAAELDPASLLVLSDLGFFYLAAGRFEEAIVASRDSLDVEPDFEPALRVIVAAASALERHEEAAAAVLRLYELAGEPPPGTDASSATDIVKRFHAWDLSRIEALGDEASPLARALRYAAASHRDRALELLEESFERHEGFLVFLTGFPELSELRSDPRFRALAERIGLLDGIA